MSENTEAAFTATEEGILNGEKSIDDLFAEIEQDEMDAERRIQAAAYVMFLAIGGIGCVGMVPPEMRVIAFQSLLGAMCAQGFTEDELSHIMFHVNDLQRQKLGIDDDGDEGPVIVTV
jgi:hypothetical protein